MVWCTQCSSQELHNAHWRRGLEVEPFGKLTTSLGIWTLKRRILVSEFGNKTEDLDCI